MFNDVTEARQANHAAIGIIDDYVKCLIRKDTLILRQEEVIDTLRDRVKALENLVYTEIPRDAEVSQ
jgi:hypothetical protein